MKYCGKSWQSTQPGAWDFCSLSANHEGPCECAGTVKPDGAAYFGAYDAAQIAIRNERVTRAEERRK
jgi:hypothetical protein